MAIRSKVLALLAVFACGGASLVLMQTTVKATSYNPYRPAGNYQSALDAAWRDPTGNALGGIYGTIVNRLLYTDISGNAANSGWVMLQKYGNGGEFAQTGWYQTSSSSVVQFAESLGGTITGNFWISTGAAVTVGAADTYSVQTTQNGTFTFWKNGTYFTQVYNGLDTAGYDSLDEGAFATEVHDQASEMGGERDNREQFSGVNLYYGSGWQAFGWADGTQLDHPYYSLSQTSTTAAQTWDQYCRYSQWPAVVYDSGRNQQSVFWPDSGQQGWEGYYTPSGGWHSSVSMNFGTMGSTPTAINDPNQNQEVVFWQGTNNQLWESYYNGSWIGPVQVGTLSGGSVMATAPGALYDTAQQQQVIFWTGTDGNLYEIYWHAGTWSPATQVKNGSGGSMGPLGSAPSSAYDSANGQQLVFWNGGGSGSLWEAFWTPGSGWAGPSSVSGTSGTMSSRPSVAFDSHQNQQLVFWQGTTSDSPQYTLHEDVYSSGWGGQHVVSNMGALASAPTVAFDSATNEQLLFWKGNGTGLFESWWSPSSGWNGPSYVGYGNLG